ncbi:MAG TPA: HAD family phosphatase [Acidisarcina sp.]
MIKALLCDIDGTLVDSNWLHAAAWKDAFASEGIQVDLEEARRQIGKGGDELIPVFVPDEEQRKSIEERLKERRKKIFEEKYLAQVKALPMAREFLQRLKEKGIALALASSSDKDGLKAYKKIVGMENLIDEETTADDAERAKPHPDIFQVALKKAGVEAADALALGDTPYDAEAAGKAGVKTIGVTTGGWSERELLDAGCIEVYPNVADLLKSFDESALNRK